MISQASKFCALNFFKIQRKILYFCSMEIFDDLELLYDPDIDELIKDVIIPDRKYELRPRTNHFTKWNENECYNRFRLSKATVMLILQDIERDLKNRTEWNLSRAVPTMDKLLLTLRFLATGDFYIAMGDFVGVHKTTAGRIIRQGLIGICNLFAQYISLPRTQEEQEAGKRDFYNVAHFPRVIGAIDCTHIKVQSPGGENSEVYRNRKGFFSLNCQVVCNAKLEIIDLVSRWPGSAHDSHIFQNSALKIRLENGEMGNGILVGDRGYPVKPYILTPLDNPQNEAETLYNEAQIRTRNAIERLFGIWKRRFPILSVGMRCKLELAQIVISACAVLHNIAVRQNEEMFEVDDNFEEFQENQINDEVVNDDHGARITFINYFQNM